MQARFEALDALQQELEQLLRLLDRAWDPSCDDCASLARALESCRLCFEALKRAPRGAAAGPEADRAWQSRLEGVLRLNAVCLGRLETVADLMSLALARAQEQRRRLSALRAAPQAGASCDISG